MSSVWPSQALLNMGRLLMVRPLIKSAASFEWRTAVQGLRLNSEYSAAWVMSDTMKRIRAGSRGAARMSWPNSPSVAVVSRPALDSFSSRRSKPRTFASRIFSSNSKLAEPSAYCCRMVFSKRRMGSKNNPSAAVLRSPESARVRKYREIGVTPGRPGRFTSAKPWHAVAMAQSAEAAIKGVEAWRSEEHTSELQSHSDLVCRLLLEKKKNNSDQHLPVL